MDEKHWDKIFTVRDAFFPLHHNHKILMAVIHQNKIKMWGKELIQEFNDEYEEEGGEDSDEAGDGEEDQNEFRVVGPLNYIFPLILK